MTKTIFGKKLLMIATITVLVTGLTLAVTLDDAEAKKPNPKVKPFKCSSSGTFDGITGDFSQTGNCSHMGETTTSGTFGLTGGFPLVDGFVCATIESTDTELTGDNGDTVEMSITGIQCFFDENGNPVDAGGFCGAGEAHTSTVVGTYDITGGDGRFTEATGSGTILSNANHCDEEPNTDTFESTISGTIEYAASNKS